VGIKVVLFDDPGNHARRLRRGHIHQRGCHMLYCYSADSELLLASAALAGAFKPFAKLNIQQQQQRHPYPSTPSFAACDKAAAY